MRGKQYYFAISTAMLTLLNACGDQPGTFVPTQTDKIDVHVQDAYRQADAVLQADYVFVLDYSRSMQDSGKSKEIMENMDIFAEHLESVDVDFRVGFINGGIQSTDSGSLEKIMTALSKDFFGSWITAEDKGNISAATAANLQTLGASNSNNRRLLMESAHNVLEAKQADFLRPAAQLVYVFMSDNDDQANTMINANRTPQYYEQKLASYKVDSCYVSARSFTAGVASNCTPTTGVGGDAPGTRIAQTARLLDEKSDFPAAEDKCIYDPTTEQLEYIARNVTKPTNRFILRGTPLEGSEIRVFVDGSEVASEDNWEYNRATNELLFKAGQEPDPSAALRIVYEQGFYLTKKPKLESVEVLIDGKTVPMNESNGWSYSAGDNRIVFNGGAQPPNGSKLTITYQQLN